MEARATNATVLVVDDERNIRESVRMTLSSEGLHVIAAHDAASAVRTLHEVIVDVLILDIRLGAADGIALYKKMRVDGIDVPTIFISGHASLSEAAEAVRVGAFDFLEKPFSAEKLGVTVRRCLEHAALEERLRRGEQQSRSTGIVGDSRVVRELIATIKKIASSNATVLIQGESGTGKELVASTIHTQSTRADLPFVKVNCSAIPDSLIESELFGFERGAFSGALTARRGMFELANRGTIFLDEVADLSLSAQAKILRVLQSGELQKLGAQQALKVDVRIVAATHKDLKQCVSDNLFREDLYYRLNVVPIRVPSLRERSDDIPLLVSVLSATLCAKNNLKEKRWDPAVVDTLKTYSWPGNVRELQNVVERMLILSDDVVSLSNLPDDLCSAATSQAAAQSSALTEFRNNAERDFIISALRRHHGNVTRAATDLGVSRTYLHRRLIVLGIEKSTTY